MTQLAKQVQLDNGISISFEYLFTQPILLFRLKIVTPFLSIPKKVWQAIDEKFVVKHYCREQFFCNIISAHLLNN